MPDRLLILAALYFLSGFILSAGLRGFSPTERAVWGLFFPAHAFILYVLTHPKLLTSVGVPASFAAVVWYRYTQHDRFRYPDDIPQLLFETAVVFGAWSVGVFFVGGLLLQMKKGLDSAFEEFLK